MLVMASGICTTRAPSPKKCSKCIQWTCSESPLKIRNEAGRVWHVRGSTLLPLGMFFKHLNTGSSPLALQLSRKTITHTYQGKLPPSPRFLINGFNVSFRKRTLVKIMCDVNKSVLSFDSNDWMDQLNQYMEAASLSSALYIVYNTLWHRKAIKALKGWKKDTVEWWPCLHY